MRYGNATDKQVRRYLKSKTEDGAVSFEYTDTQSIIRISSPKALYAADRRYLEDNGFKYEMGRWFRKRTLHPTSEKLASLKLLKENFSPNFFTQTFIDNAIDAEENISIDKVIGDLNYIINQIKTDINKLENYSE